MLDIQIAKPCDQSWTSMKGDERARFCGACRKNVYNIAEMTEKEVEELIQRTEGHFCARIYRRSDQRVMTADCPKGMARVRRKRTLAVTAAFGVVASGVLAFPVFGQGKVARVRHSAPMAKPVEPPTNRVRSSPTKSISWTFAWGRSRLSRSDKELPKSGN